MMTVILILHQKKSFARHLKECVIQNQFVCAGLQKYSKTSLDLS